MRPKQYEIWLADLNPQIGTEPGKTRPVVVVQTDLLNEFHPSTLVCPVTTNVVKQIELLRVHLKKGVLSASSDILVDQLSAIDNRRFRRRMGKLTREQSSRLKENIKIVFDL
jgi:mRNA interferase MazF